MTSATYCANMTVPPSPRRNRSRGCERAAVHLPLQHVPAQLALRVRGARLPMGLMSEPFRDALAAALGVGDSETRGYVSEAGRIIAALPPEWRDYLAAREPLLALVAVVPA